MSVAEFKQEIAVIIREVGYINSFEIAEETANTIKIRLIINDSCFVQIYFNCKKNLKNYAAIISGQRVYGRDCDGGKWHKHPWENPDGHVFIREVSLKDFLFEVYEGFKERGIL